MGRHSPVLGVAIVLATSTALIVFGGAKVPDPLARADAEPVVAGLRFEDWPASESAERGRLVCEQYCIGRHGDTGKGDGAAASWLRPLPRNFQKGNYKFRSTPSGELPTVDDLLHIVACGLQGSAMPAFPLMSEIHRRDVADYVLSLTRFGLLKNEVSYLIDDDGLTMAEIMADEFAELEEEVMYDAFEEVWPVAVPLRPETDEDTIAHGAELYKAQCTPCHGVTGIGDGPSSFTLRDWKDDVVRPRDLTTGIFRAGSTPADLFLRMRTGLNGTPMPAVYGSDDDLWAIVDFILSLQDEDTVVPPHPVSCAALESTSAAH
ncbi:MAG: mono/diheme cytochrome c family protein [Pseudohongiellaceae bacterium]|jgi:mono/diheme cytochrome c family protein